MGLIRNKEKNVTELRNKTYGLGSRYWFLPLCKHPGSVPMKGSDGSLYSSGPQSFRVRVNKTDQAMEWAEELNDLFFFFFFLLSDITRIYGISCRETRGQSLVWPQSSRHTEKWLGLEWQPLETEPGRKSTFWNSGRIKAAQWRLSWALLPCQIPARTTSLTHSDSTPFRGPMSCHVVFSVSDDLCCVLYTISASAFRTKEENLLFITTSFFMSGTQ